MYLVNTPYLLKKFYPSLIWEIPNNNNHVYLTFDDGPTPNITEKVLEILREHKAKATFFCIGKNVEKFPALYNKIIQEGHLTANHSYSHQNGWKLNDTNFISEIEKCKEFVSSSLFRPPYGKITFSQIEKLKPHFRIIMWSILSADFDKNISPQQCLLNSTENLKSGSIVVFHDSEKAKENLLFALPCFLKFCADNNLTTDVLPSFTYSQKQ